MLTDFLHIVDVLRRHLRHGDIEDVEILLANEVEQQIQRPLKGFKKNLQRIGRNIEVLRHGKQRFAIELGHRHGVGFILLGGHGGQVQILALTMHGLHPRTQTQQRIGAGGGKAGTKRRPCE